MAKLSQLRFEMPYQVDAPVLTDEASGIDRVRLCSRDQETVIRLLDTADERLLCAGVLLLPHQQGEQAEWIVRPGEWREWIETATWQDQSGDEVPDSLGPILAPFRRSAPLVTIASVTTERARYELLDIDGAGLGCVLDDRVTVRRAGLAVSRRRQVTVEPTDEMTSLQQAVVSDRLMDTGGRCAQTFGDPIDQLTEVLGICDIGEPGKTEELTTERFVGCRLTRCLRSVLRADLTRRSGLSDTGDALIAELRELQRVIDGMRSLLEPVWADELRWKAGRAIGRLAEGENDPHFEVLDMLSSGARAPRVQESGPVTAILTTEASVRFSDLLARLDALDITDDATWSDARAAVDAVGSVLELAEGRIGRTTSVERRLTKLGEILQPTLGEIPCPQPGQIAALDPLAAYELGRSYQAQLDSVSAPRERLLGELPRLRRKLKEQWIAPLESVVALESCDE